MTGHDLAQIEILADSVALLSEGRVVATGPPRGLIREFFGDDHECRISLDWPPEVGLAQTLETLGLRTEDGKGLFWFGVVDAETAMQLQSRLPDDAPIIELRVRRPGWIRCGSTCTAASWSMPHDRHGGQSHVASVWRDRGALALAFGLPPLMFLVFAEVFSGAGDSDLDMRVALLDSAQTPLTRQIGEAIAALDGIEPVEHALTADAAGAAGLEDLVRQGRADAGVLIRAEPDGDLDAEPAIVVIGDASRALAAAIVTGRVQRLLQAEFPALGRAPRGGADRGAGRPVQRAAAPGAGWCVVGARAGRSGKRGGRSKLSARHGDAAPAWRRSAGR